MIFVEIIIVSSLAAALKTEEQMRTNARLKGRGGMNELLVLRKMAII